MVGHSDPEGAKLLVADPVSHDDPGPDDESERTRPMLLGELQAGTTYLCDLTGLAHPGHQNPDRFVSRTTFQFEETGYPLRAERVGADAIHRVSRESDELAITHRLDRLLDHGLTATT
jgi:hypothetical protein